MGDFFSNLWAHIGGALTAGIGVYATSNQDWHAGLAAALSFLVYGIGHSVVATAQGSGASTTTTK